MKVRAFGKPVSTLYPNQEASIGDYVELRVEARHIQITADRSRLSLRSCVGRYRLPRVMLARSASVTPFSPDSHAMSDTKGAPLALEHRH